MEPQGLDRLSNVQMTNLHHILVPIYYESKKGSARDIGNSLGSESNYYVKSYSSISSQCLLIIFKSFLPILHILMARFFPPHLSISLGKLTWYYVCSRHSIKCPGKQCAIMLKNMNFGVRIHGFKSKWCSLLPRSVTGQIT